MMVCEFITLKGWETQSFVRPVYFRFSSFTISLVKFQTFKEWVSFFSAPEPSAQVHYCLIGPSVVRPLSLIFHIFDFSSETT